MSNLNLSAPIIAVTGRKALLKTLFIFLFFSALFLQCTQQSPSEEAIKTIMKMEYHREADPSAWRSFVDTEQSPYIRQEALRSLGHIKPAALVPFLDSLLDQPFSLPEKRAIVFALGQSAETEAESRLLKRFPSFGDSLKKETLLALRQCGGAASVPLLKKLLSHATLYRPALITAGILARKKIDTRSIYQTVTDSSWQHRGSFPHAYFLYYAAAKKDIEYLKNLLSVHPGEARKYYLKALSRILSQGNILNDSLKSVLGAQINANLSLKYKPSWNELYHALHIVNILADSSAMPLVRQSMNHMVPHVRFEALKAFQSIAGKKSLSLLLAHLKKTKSLAEKALLINLISKTKQTLGYQLVNQYLDKGNSTFKAGLLEALAHINNRMVRQTLRNFLNTRDPLLVHKAFSLLDKKRWLRFRDVEALMSTPFYGVLNEVLAWQKRNGKSVASSMLIDAFQRFRKADHFESQELIIELLAQKKPGLNNAQLNTLEEALSSERVARSYREKLQPAYSGARIATVHPAYISADSALSILGKNITARIKTNRGEITVVFFTGKTPLTVINFLKLASTGFYNNLSFHRVVADFVIQGGDPEGDGYGGPGYTIPSEDGLPFERGTLGIATSGFDTGGSQIFICHSRQPHLRGNYTAFGRVTGGMTVVDAILPGDTITSIQLSIK